MERLKLAAAAGLVMTAFATTALAKDADPALIKARQKFPDDERWSKSGDAHEKFREHCN